MSAFWQRAWTVAGRLGAFVVTGFPLFVDRGVAFPVDLVLILFPRVGVAALEGEVDGFVLAAALAAAWPVMGHSRTIHV